MAVLAVAVASTLTIAGAGSDSTATLASMHRGADSVTFTNETTACGPWNPSTRAVVWHLEVTDRDPSFALESAEVRFADGIGSSVVIDGGSVWVRTLGHARLVAADVTWVRHGDAPAAAEPSVRLDHVCYRGIGPVAEIELVFQAVLCDDWTAIDGNQVTRESANWDDTAGRYREWGHTYDGDAPRVRQLADLPEGCDWDDAQRYAIGTSPKLANRTMLPMGVGVGPGTRVVSSRDLPSVFRQALSAGDGELWITRDRRDDVAFGAFQCHDERLHPDDVEYLSARRLDRAPVVCVAWNVALPR